MMSMGLVDIKKNVYENKQESLSCLLSSIIFSNPDKQKKKKREEVISQACNWTRTNKFTIETTNQLNTIDFINSILLSSTILVK